MAMPTEPSQPADLRKTEGPLHGLSFQQLLLLAFLLIAGLLGVSSLRALHTLEQLMVQSRLGAAEATALGTAAQALKADPAKVSAVADMRAAIAHYPQYFDDPGWDKPVPVEHVMHDEP